MLDIRLEGSLDGRDVLRILRETDKDTKVAMITGDLLAQEEIQELAGLGIVDFLYKPVDFQTLENVIKKALEHSYPKAIRFEAIKIKKPADESSSRSIAHDLTNITSDIANKCELFILDEEEGFNKDKSEKDRLNEATNILKAILKQTERITGIVNKLSPFTKKL